MQPFPHSRSIFVSATSRGLGPVREQITKVLRKQNIRAVEQSETFDVTGTKVRRQIEDELGQVSGIICLVGPYYGVPLEPMNLDHSSRISYTQWECLVALRRGEGHRKVYLIEDEFFGQSPGVDTKAEIDAAIPDSRHFHQWQREFREYLERYDHPRAHIRSAADLWYQLACINWNDWPEQ